MQSSISRTVRLVVSPHDHTPPNHARHNSHAGWPSPDRLAAWFEIVVELAGSPDPETGYILGIDRIDEAVRDAAPDPLGKALLEEKPPGVARLLLDITDLIEKSLDRGTSAVRLRLTPRHEVSWETCSEIPMQAQDHKLQRTLLLRDRFEFAASHRLHCPQRDAEWNASTFGKCNNPAGHGHNYQLEVEVETSMDASGSPALSFQQLEKIVDEAVIQRFDHKNLNEDCGEFAEIIPSVENITLACHDLLVDAIGDTGARLRRVTVWETEKTSCTYPVEAAHGT